MVSISILLQLEVALTYDLSILISDSLPFHMFAVELAMTYGAWKP